MRTIGTFARGKKIGQVCNRLRWWRCALLRTKEFTIGWPALYSLGNRRTLSGGKLGQTSSRKWNFRGKALYRSLVALGVAVYIQCPQRSRSAHLGKYRPRRGHQAIITVLDGWWSSCRISGAPPWSSTASGVSSVYCRGPWTPCLPLRNYVSELDFCSSWSYPVGMTSLRDANHLEKGDARFALENVHVPHTPTVLWARVTPLPHKVTIIGISQSHGEASGRDLILCALHPFSRMPPTERACPARLWKLRDSELGTSQW